MSTRIKAESAFIESFNGKLRDECLNETLFSAFTEETLSELTPYEYICKIWISEPDRFILNLINQRPGLKT